MKTLNCWPQAAITEMGFVGRGKSCHRPRNDPKLYGGPYPFIKTADISSSYLYINTYSQTYSEQGLAQSKIWEPGTLCIVNAGVNTGDSAILNFRACFPDSVIAFIPDPDKADVRYVKYCLVLIKPLIRQVTMGTTQDNLSVEKLTSFKLPFPAVAIQRKLASVISTYDDLIENNTRRIVILEEMARRIYEEWFVHFRFPGHEQVKMVESELGLIPEGWQVGQLRNMAQLLSGFAFKTKDFVDDGSFGLVTIKNVQDGEFVSQCASRLATIPPKLPSHCHLSTGDVLLVPYREYWPLLHGDWR